MKPPPPLSLKFGMDEVDVQDMAGQCILTVRSYDECSASQWMDAEDVVELRDWLTSWLAAREGTGAA